MFNINHREVRRFPTMHKEFDPVSQDDPRSDEDYPSSLEHLYFDSDGSKMLGMILKAQGEGPHPTAIFLHGFPGDEKNYDLAHVLHRAGWNSVIFHYRGSWGSEGNFSFSNMIEDVHACIEHLRSPEWNNVVDGSRITLIGHSMGGWAGMMAASEDPTILNLVFIAGFNLGGMKDLIIESEMNRRFVMAGFNSLVAPLGGADPEDLVNEIILKGSDWDLLRIVERLKGMRILMIGAVRDPTAIPELHHMPIMEVLKGIGSGGFTEEMLETDHNFSDNRIALARIILDWSMVGV
jgi:pimeloyl-ACP methyl ester carboxylesterase